MRRSAHRHGEDPRRRGLDPDRHARHLLGPAAGRATTAVLIDAGIGRRAARGRPCAARRAWSGSSSCSPTSTSTTWSGSAYLPGLRGAGGIPPRIWGPAQALFGGSSDEVLRRDLLAAVLRRRLRAGRRARCGSWRRGAGDRPVHARTAAPGGPQHADAGAALRRPPHLLHGHALRRRQRRARGRRRVLMHEAWSTEGSPRGDADPLLRPRRGRGGARGGRRAARAHPPAPARRARRGAGGGAGASSPAAELGSDGSRSSSSPAGRGWDERPRPGPVTRPRAGATRSAASAPTRRGRLSSSASSWSAVRWSSASSSRPAAVRKSVYARRSAGSRRRSASPRCSSSSTSATTALRWIPSALLRACWDWPSDGGEVAEHPEVPRVKAEAGETLREAPMRVGAQLREQEAGAAAESGICGHVGDSTAQRELFLI